MPGFLDYLPTKKFTIKVKPEEVLASEAITVRDSSELIDRMTIDLGNKNYVAKNEIAALFMVDSISRTGWKRPIYFATTVGPEMFLGMDKYFRLVGLAYQIVPLANGGTQSCDIDRTYDNLMNKFEWGNIQDSTIYLDENNRRMCKTQRMMFCTLISELIEASQNAKDSVEEGGYLDRALKATEFCEKTIPSYNIPHDYTSLTLAQCYCICGETEKGKKIVESIVKENDEYLQWALALPKNMKPSLGSQICNQVLTMKEALSVAATYNMDDVISIYETPFREYINSPEFKKAASRR